MKLSEYISQLKDFMDEYGDLNCFYSSDNEGNNYQKVVYGPSKFFTTNPEGYRVNMLSGEDMDDLDDEDKSEYFKICVIN
jgi:hypothetical protein